MNSDEQPRWRPLLCTLLWIAGISGPIVFPLGVFAVLAGLDAIWVALLLALPLLVVGAATNPFFLPRRRLLPRFLLVAGIGAWACLCWSMHGMMPPALSLSYLVLPGLGILMMIVSSRLCKAAI